MNHIELNAILYYADFLSLKEVGYPVTDNCKYFFIHGTPINSLFILDLEPEYDLDNKYILQAKIEYNIIKEKCDEDGVESFIDEICSLKARGSVDAEQMLKYIHHYSSKKERKLAFDSYKAWKNNQIYTHTIIDEDGNPQEKQCSSYVYHVERMLGKRGVVESIRNNTLRYENKVERTLI